MLRLVAIICNSIISKINSQIMLIMSSFVPRSTNLWVITYGGRTMVVSRTGVRVRDSHQNINIISVQSLDSRLPDGMDLEGGTEKYQKWSKLEGLTGSKTYHDVGWYPKSNFSNLIHVEIGQRKRKSFHFNIINIIWVKSSRFVNFIVIKKSNLTFEMFVRTSPMFKPNP